MWSRGCLLQRFLSALRCCRECAFCTCPLEDGSAVPHHLPLPTADFRSTWGLVPLKETTPTSGEASVPFYFLLHGLLLCVQNKWQSWCLKKGADLFPRLILSTCLEEVWFMCNVDVHCILSYHKEGMLLIFSWFSCFSTEKNYDFFLITYKPLSYFFLFFS